MFILLFLRQKSVSVERMFLVCDVDISLLPS